jgi:hypothetical protein
MRIRTIKPEFWNHPIMGRASDAAKLMAIGLLNIADDKGFFYLDEILIRNAVRPFDKDSRNTHGALTELSVMGYFETREHAKHGKIGWIEGFERHQVINRPSKQSMRELWDSSTAHGALTECSRSTHTGREGKGRERKGIPPNPQGGMWDREIELIDEEQSPEPPPSNALPSPTDPKPSSATDTPQNNPKPFTGHPDAKNTNTIRASWKNMTAIQKKQTRVKTTTPEMLAIGRLMGRRDGSLWSVAEAIALEAVNPQSDEIEEMSRYYLADIDRDKDFRRRDLITLLNNWNGELDRARIFKSN